MIKHTITAGLVVLSLVGSTAAETTPPVRSAPTIESLLPRIDRVVAKAHSRELRSDRHSPWVVLHAVIAFGDDVHVLDVEKNETINAIDYLLTRATHDGKRIFRDEDGEPALPTWRSPGGPDRPLLVQDHVDQYLMVLTDTGVKLGRKISAEGGRVFTMADMLAASKRNFVRGQELGWTLVVMSGQLKPGEAWTTKRDERYGIEDLVGLALQRNPVRETEGGPHHLYGIAFALREHLRRGGDPEGIWKEAETYLGKYIDLARQWQQPDGAFSGGMFRDERAPDAPRRLVSTTGHMLEWLAVALPADELKQAWVARAVARLCDAFENNALDDFSDGGLYHAVHALRLYREALS